MLLKLVSSTLSKLGRLIYIVMLDHRSIKELKVIKIGEGLCWINLVYNYLKNDILVEDEQHAKLR